MGISGLKVHFSSRSNSLETLDVCATPENAKCEKYYRSEEDGLKQEWKGLCWMNPPCGREIWKMDKEGVRISLSRHHRGLSGAGKN